MKEILEKKYSRQLFFGTVVLLTISFGLIRYYTLPYFFPAEVKTGSAIFLSTLFDGLLISLLVTVFIGGFLFWMQPEELKTAKIEAIDQRELAEIFGREFPSTTCWFYKGGCGRNFRTKTLPEMAKWARKKSMSREIRAVILNPIDKRLCRAHSTYRRSTASVAVEDSKWTEWKVRTELCATIFATLAFQVEEPMLRINLSLSASYSAFRIDLSDEHVIITKEDRSAPAIMCPDCVKTLITF